MVEIMYLQNLHTHTYYCDGADTPEEIISDCHNKSMLDCKFDEAAELLKGCGYKEKYVLTDCGFTAVSL